MPKQAQAKFGADGILTRAEAAKKLRCSLRALDRRIASGAIAARTDGGRRTLIDAKSLQDYLDNLPVRT